MAALRLSRSGVKCIGTNDPTASAEGSTSGISAIARVSVNLPEGESTSLRVAALVLCTGRSVILSHAALPTNVQSAAGILPSCLRPSKDGLSGYPVEKTTLEALASMCAPLSRSLAPGKSEGMAAMLGFLGAVLDGIDALQ